jgi:hypothetical protein
LASGRQTLLDRLGDRLRGLLELSAPCCSTLLAGSRLETSQPRPKATTPAANGLPDAFCFTVDGACDATSATVWPALLAAPATVEPRCSPTGDGGAGAAHEPATEEPAPLRELPALPSSSSHCP